MEEATPFYPIPESFESLVSFMTRMKDSKWHEAGESHQVESVESNPSLTEDSHLYQLWRHGIQVMKQLSPSGTMRVAYHGTHSEKLTSSICEHGFDPSRRRTQGFGAGEYFSGRPEGAIPYAAGTKQILCCIILNGPQTRTRRPAGFSSDIVICNNPPSRAGATFSLPIFTITYRAQSSDNKEASTQDAATSSQLQQTTLSLIPGQLASP